MALDRAAVTVRYADGPVREQHDPVPGHGVHGAGADRHRPFLARVPGDGVGHRQTGGRQGAEQRRSEPANQGGGGAGRAERAEGQPGPGPVRARRGRGPAARGQRVFRHGAVGHHSAGRPAQHRAAAHVHVPADRPADRTG